MKNMIKGIAAKFYKVTPKAYRIVFAMEEYPDIFDSDNIEKRMSSIGYEETIQELCKHEGFRKSIEHYDNMSDEQILELAKQKRDE